LIGHDGAELAGQPARARIAIMAKDTRRNPRRKLGSRAWIRFDDGFSVRPCRVVDVSENGVRIEVDAPRVVASRFSLLMSRDAAPGRLCQVKWRRGSTIGAEFVRQ
jgi:hypothetical protein